MGKFLITIFGHSGFIGTNLKNFCLKDKIKIFLPKKNQYKFKKNLGHIIYCIGTGEAKNDPLKAVRTNFEILKEILDNNEFKSLTYFSTTRVYLHNKNTSEEDKIINDLSDDSILFSLIKLSAEKLCLNIKKKNIRVIRLTNIYGHHFTKQLYLLPVLIRGAKKDKKIKITINKNSLKNYLHIDEAIPIILKISTIGKDRIYNLAGKKRYKFIDIATKIQKKTKCKIFLSNQKKTYNDPIINIDKIINEFKFNPKRNLLDDLDEIISNCN
jgi:nucleoside-diphosphate-sugar epimerase